jgi:hypothetical protein
MKPVCPRCQTPNEPPARFCAHCGLRLELQGGVPQGAGRLRHPDPLTPPEGLRPISTGVDLYYAWRAAGGNAPLLGTETLEVELFNAGYDLAMVELVLRGCAADGTIVVELNREFETWSRDQKFTCEIASWELPEPIRDLDVALVAAEFASDA